MNNSFSVNVLINGQKCKQNPHEGKSYIEAKIGSEWILKIKNNTSGRILAICSVDGLDVISGKTASENNSGYIISSYSSQKIKGFRISDNEWAKFIFGYKSDGNTYAQSKHDGSEKNCGVIGVKLYYEKEEPVIHYYDNQINNIQWKDSCGNTSLGGLYGPGRYGYTGLSNGIYNCCNNTPLYLKSSQPTYQKLNFDSGTEFGRSETSKVKTVEFKKGSLALSKDIFYASRKALISMGVCLTSNNELEVNNFPESFPNKYCKPPKNWRG